MLSELFSQVLSRRIKLSDADRLVACAILNDRLVASYNPTDAQRAALAIATIEDTNDPDGFARLLATTFREDVEVLAGVCMALVRSMSLKWDGVLATLDTAMLASSRTAAVLGVFIERLEEDLRTGHDSAGWKLSGRGRLFLEQINDVDLLGAIAERAPSNMAALIRLANIGAVEQLAISCSTAPPVSDVAWVSVMDAIPGKPASVERFCTLVLDTRLPTRVRNDVLHAREQVLLYNRPDLFDSLDHVATFMNHAGR